MRCAAKQIKMQPLSESQLSTECLIACFLFINTASLISNYRAQQHRNKKPQPTPLLGPWERPNFVTADREQRKQAGGMKDGILPRTKPKQK